MLVMTIVMACKIGFVVFLVISHQGFLTNKGLVVNILNSVLLTLMLSCLHGFPASFLVSITDDIGAIIISMFAGVWALTFLISSIPAVKKAIVD